MRGRLKARREALELALFTAWQTERFAREEKLQGLGHYTKRLRRRAKQGPRDMLAYFQSLRLGGASVKITKLKP